MIPTSADLQATTAALEAALVALKFTHTLPLSTLNEWPPEEITGTVTTPRGVLTAYATILETDSLTSDAESFTAVLNTTHREDGTAPVLLTAVILTGAARAWAVTNNEPTLNVKVHLANDAFGFNGAAIPTRTGLLPLNRNRLLLDGQWHPTILPVPRALNLISRLDTAVTYQQSGPLFINTTELIAGQERIPLTDLRETLNLVDAKDLH